MNHRALGSVLTLWAAENRERLIIAFPKADHRLTVRFAPHPDSAADSAQLTQPKRAATPIFRTDESETYTVKTALARTRTRSHPLAAEAPSSGPIDTSPVATPLVKEHAIPLAESNS